MTGTRRLYHYTSYNAGLEILRQRRIKFSRIGDLNDPFEGDAEATTDRAHREKIKQRLKTLEQRYGIFCLSKSDKSVLLWSLYAVRHRGVCLGFDIDGGDCRDVDYHAKRTELGLRKTDRNPDEKELLLNKFNSWNFEEEVRLISCLDDLTKDGSDYYQEFSKGLVLSEILVGHRCKQFSCIKALVQESGVQVPLHQMRLRWGSYGVKRSEKATKILMAKTVAPNR